MICQNCKTNNEEDAVFCSKCKQKIQVICPKCKTKNKPDSEKCVSCNLRLIRYCPVCTTANKPLSLECVSCKTPLLKKCPKCGAINLIHSKNCKKCSFQLKKTEKSYSPHPVIRVELSNYDYYVNEIKNTQTGDKLIKRFFQTLVLCAKEKNLKVLKISNKAAGVEIKETKPDSAIGLAIKIMQKIQEINNSLTKFGAEYEIKIFIAQAASSSHKFCRHLSDQTPNNCLCLDKKIADFKKNEFNFEKVSEEMYKVVGTIKQADSEQLQKNEIKKIKLEKPEAKIEQTNFEERELPNKENIQAEHKIEETNGPSLADDKKSSTRNEQIVKQEKATEKHPQIQKDNKTSPTLDIPDGKGKQQEDSNDENKTPPAIEPIEEVAEKKPQELEEQKCNETSTSINIPDEKDKQQEDSNDENKNPPAIEPIEEVAEKKPQELEEPKQRTEPANHKTQNSQRAFAFENIKNAISKNRGGFISISSEAGFGKTTLLNKIFEQLEDQHICFLQADCHVSSHNTPFATLQGMIRSMLGLPIININTTEMISRTEKTLKDQINIQDPEVINTIINLINPNIESENNIQEAKIKLFKAINILFKKVKQLQRVLILIEEIESLDMASAEVFDYLIDQGFLEDAFLVATTSNATHPSIVFNSENLAQNIISNVALTALNDEEIDESIQFYIKNKDDIPEQLYKQLKEKTKGCPILLEEIIIFLSQAGLIQPDENGNVIIKPNVQNLTLPEKLEEVIALRLDTLFQAHEEIHQLLAHASCFGYTFFPPLIQQVTGMDKSTFDKSMQILIMSGICQTFDNVNFKFKNKHIFEMIKQILIQDDEEFKQINTNLLNGLLEHTDAYHSQIAEIAQNAEDPEKAFNLFITASKESISTGDAYLYMLCQKGALNNIDHSDCPDKDKQKIDLYEELGITNYENFPEDSIEFLSKAIEYYENQNHPEKIINLSGYLVKSLQITGNLQEAIGYIEKSTEYLSLKDNKIEIALMKFLKLKFLFEIGNLGELITLIQSEILPNLHEEIKKNKNIDITQRKNIKEAIFQSQIMLLKTLALQGNKNYYAAVESFAKNHEITTTEVEIFAIDALHKTFNGTPQSSEASIQKTKSILKSSDNPKKEQILVELELFSLLNKFLYSGKSIAQDVGPLAQKAKKINNSFVYNFLQVTFAKQLVENKDLSNAANLINDCLTYFAEQKIALFAIPSWIVLCHIQKAFQDYDQGILIAQQALEVASKPQIQNNYAIVEIKKLLAEFFLAKGDDEMAKIHLEEGINYAKENEMIFWEAKLYVSLSDLYTQLAKKGKDTKQNIESAKEIVDLVYEIAKSLKCTYLEKQATKQLSQIPS